MKTCLLILSTIFASPAVAFLVPSSPAAAFLSPVLHPVDDDMITRSSPPLSFQPSERRNIHTIVLRMSEASSSSSTTKQAPTDFLKDLLEHLTGERLLAASSGSWRKAIYEAVGAPDTADSKIVAKALEDAMRRPDNQFAILMGAAEDFVATFPSDTVSYDDDETCWVECRLRRKDDDELLVTMGINLTHQTDTGNWGIQSLDWQDFRDEFYPGLSGREWLRAF